jgi:hypothetical protein
MLPLDKQNLKAALVAVAIALVAWALLSGKAHAQTPGNPLLPLLTLPGVPGACGPCVTDPPTEFSTEESAYSLITGGGGGWYEPNATYISSLDQGLFSAVNSQNFTQYFPGWLALPPNSTDTEAKPVTAVTLATYLNAFNVVQSQMTELQGESFSAIEQKSSTATALLTATQANTEAVLAVAQGIQYERQLLATLIVVEATKAAEELNADAREQATNATQFNLGVAP